MANDYSARQPRRKYCQFCKENTEYIDYKDTQLLRKYMTDRGKIKPRRVTGACTQHQHDIANAIKRAREMALLPYTVPVVSSRGLLVLRVPNERYFDMANDYSARQPRRKYCQFCKENTEYIDYKDTQLLRKYMTDRGKIKPRRVTGACTQHQHDIANAIKRAREMALLPYTVPVVSSRGNRDRG